jgi:hypothetical protein
MFIGTTISEAEVVSQAIPHSRIGSLEASKATHMPACYAGHHPILSMGEKNPAAGPENKLCTPCPRSPGLTPRSPLGYLIVDSLIITARASKLYGKHNPTTGDGGKSDCLNCDTG